MTFNQQILNLIGVTETDYRDWCRKNHKSMNKAESKKEFFARVSDGRLVRDANTGELIKKRPRK